MQLNRLLVCCGVLLAWPALLSAADPEFAGDEALAQRWIRQLQADEFAMRREARAALMQMRQAAVPLLRQAAEKADAGHAEDCVSVLAWFAHQEDAALSQAASLALMELTQVESATTSQLAKSTLAPASPVHNWPTEGRGRLNLQFRGGAVPPAANAPGEAEFDEQDRHIKVVVAANGVITIRITETRDGEKQTTEHQAESLAELFRKHRDAIRWYTEFRRQQALALIQRPIPPAGAGVRSVVERVQVVSANGVRTIDVVKSGKHTRIDDEEGHNIRATITEIVDGREVKRTIQATDLADLKSQSPETAAIYEQYGARLVLQRGLPGSP